MFGIGMPVLVLILIIGLVVFGPGKLPEVGKAIGKSLNEFKKATSGITGGSDAPPVNVTKAETKEEAVKSEPTKPEVK